MLVEAHTRMLAPLLALDAAESIHSKAHLRLLTLLAQRDLDAGTKEWRGRQGGGYVFEAGRYGPRCDALDRDATNSPSIVAHGVVTPSSGARRYGHWYRITEQGQRLLGVLKAGADERAIDCMSDRIRGMCSNMHEDLLEEAYGRFGPYAGTAHLDLMVRGDLAKAKPPIFRAFEVFTNDHATSVAAMLETVEMALSSPKLRGASDAQRRVILCLSGEAVRECADLSGLIGPPDDPALAPRLADADDLVHNLATYCEKTGIMRDPMAMPMRELVSADEMLLLCEKLESA